MWCHVPDVPQYRPCEFSGLKIVQGISNNTKGTKCCYVDKKVTPPVPHQIPKPNLKVSEPSEDPLTTRLGVKVAPAPLD